MTDYDLRRPAWAETAPPELLPRILALIEVAHRSAAELADPHLGADLTHQAHSLLGVLWPDAVREAARRQIPLGFTRLMAESPAAAEIRWERMPADEQAMVVEFMSNLSVPDATKEQEDN